MSGSKIAADLAMTGMIGLIAAMDQESRALLRLAGVWERNPIGRFRAFDFLISGQPCVLVTSGMGARRAGEAARALIEQHTPRLIVSFGIAGAVDADLEIGDVVLPEAYGPMEGTTIRVFPLASWPEPAIKAARQAIAGRGRQLFSGTAITTHGSQLAPGSVIGMKHPVLEMETAGIAAVTAEYGIPLLSLRAISDGPNAPIPINLAEVMDEDANLKLLKMVEMIFRHPGAVLQSGRMMRNTALAADIAALALLTAIATLI